MSFLHALFAATEPLVGPGELRRRPPAEVGDLRPLLLGESGDVDDVADNPDDEPHLVAVVRHAVPRDDRAAVADDRTENGIAQAGLLVQFAAGGRLGRLPGLDAAARGAPEAGAGLVHVA